MWITARNRSRNNPTVTNRVTGVTETPEPLYSNGCRVTRNRNWPRNVTGGSLTPAVTAVTADSKREEDNGG